MEFYQFYNRDLSWLSFNERVLMEAENAAVPLLEKIRFLSIYSSNLDEFYRVRMPVLMAVGNLGDVPEAHTIFKTAQQLINQQQDRFGYLLASHILPELKRENIHWVYNQKIPSVIIDQVSDVFFNEILAFIRVSPVEEGKAPFFAENNKLYQAVILTDVNGVERLEFITVPSDELQRLYLFNTDSGKYVVFIDDIIRSQLSYLFPGQTITGVYNFKVTRNAELNLREEIDEEITEALEEELKKRDLGLATRFLSQPGIPLRHLYRINYTLDLHQATIVEGGHYHNLKDLASFPVSDAELSYRKWPSRQSLSLSNTHTLLNQILEKDLMVHVPYQKYDPILRFFNEAANDRSVEEIYVTFYRVADNSRIVNALITAAKNGKRVSVLVELKARFDEANNIKWASRMKAAGVKIIYSNFEMKVHAKVALLTRRSGDQVHHVGLFATGNLNESTARFYTDHILMTANAGMLQELLQLFDFLRKNKKKPMLDDEINFRHLLVAQFNLQQKFLSLIDREIANAKQGLPANITLKMNNLEEKVLISKLYDASNAGVKIELIIRSICCLIPGIPGQSENIRIRRIVDRYLEHGRIFVFHNAGNPEIYMGSADWMNRNIYSRIEVCFPVYDREIKDRLMEILQMQLDDQSQAVLLNEKMENIYPYKPHGIGSQSAIYNLLTQQNPQEKLKVL